MCPPSLPYGSLCASWVKAAEPRQVRDRRHDKIPAVQLPVPASTVFGRCKVPPFHKTRLLEPMSSAAAISALLRGDCRCMRRPMHGHDQVYFPYSHRPFLSISEVIHPLICSERCALTRGAARVPQHVDAQSPPHRGADLTPSSGSYGVLVDNVYQALGSGGPDYHSLYAT